MIFSYALLPWGLNYITDVQKANDNVRLCHKHRIRSKDYRHNNNHTGPESQTQVSMTM